MSTKADDIRRQFEDTRPKPDIEPVEFPGRVDMFLRRATAGRADEMEDLVAKATAESSEIKKVEYFVRLAVLTLCDEDGNYVFDLNNEDHLEILRAEEISVLERIIDPLNRLLERAADAAEREAGKSESARD